MSVFTSRKIRFEILAIYLTLFVVCIAGVTYYSYSRSKTAMIKVADTLIEKTNNEIATDLDRFIQPASLFSIAKLILNDSQLDERDMQTLAGYMHVLLDSYPQLMNAYIADDKGNMFLETRVSKQPINQQLLPFMENLTLPAETANISVILMTDANGKETVRLIFKNKSGNVLGNVSPVITSFKPQDRPWYAEAKQNGQAVWIGIYNFYRTSEQVVTTAFPVYAAKQFMGVAAADVSLTALRHAIDRYSNEAQGIVFFASHTGKVISSEVYTADAEKGATLSTIDANKSGAIKTAYWEFMRTGAKHFMFTLDNVKYIVQFKTYAINGNEQWEIATIIPLNNFVGSINYAIRNALIFAIAMMIAGLLLVVLFANRLSKPIMQMAEETQDMQHFDFSHSTEIKSHIQEIQVMVNALNIAKAALYSFSKYVPKLLVDQLLRVGSIAAPGGEKKQVTILFSDIVDFTKISEVIDPNELMLQLSYYLDALTKCIHGHQGNIDKYIGDGIMAFWGAPQEDEQQVYHACLALLDCRYRVHQLNEAWQKQGKPVFATRFGLNTGAAIIGNLGSSDRLNYTAIGDTVNLAARLEETNKGYETEILVSDPVYKACNKQFLFRPVDIVWIAGKNDPVQVYELVAALNSDSIHAATRDQIELCRLFTRAFELYHTKRHAMAFEELLQLEERFPDDKLVKLYIKRCQNQLY